MSTSDAIRWSITVLNSGDPLALADWAQIARASRATLAAGGIRDQVVEFAAAVSQLVDPRKDATVHPIVEALGAGRNPDAQQVRTMLAIATHACRRGQSGRWDGLLAGVERSALDAASGPPVNDLEEALRRWPAIVAQTSLDAGPQLLTAVARQQIALLAITSHVASKAESPLADEIGIPRLRQSLAACTQGWREATGTWQSSSDHRTVPRAQATALSMAAVGIRDALMSHRESSETLRILIRTGVGGNLLTAAAASQGSFDQLLASAQELDQLTARLSRGTSHLNVMVNSLPEQASVRVMPVVTPSARTRRLSPASAEPPSVESVRLTPAIEQELARRRDLGVAAQAALDGVPSAKRLMDGVSSEELMRLSWEGRQSVGVLVASVQLAIWSRVGAAPHDRDERFAMAAAEVSASVHRWNPQRARWLTYAIQVSDWSLSRHRHASAKLPIPAQMTDTYSEHGYQGVDHKYLVSDLPDPADTATNTVDGGRAAQLIDRLSWPSNQILREAMGIARAGEPSSLAQISRRLNVSPSTVNRHMKIGLNVLRRQLGVDER